MKHIVRTPLLSVAAVATVLALSSCGGEETPAPVSEESDSAASVVESEAPEDADAVVDDSAEDSSDEAADEAADEAGSGTASLGDTVSIGPWEVKVTNVLLDANAQMKQANQFNEKPKGQYVLVDFEATYDGPERTADVRSDLRWSYTTTDSQVHDQTFAVTPLDNQDAPTQARSGGKVEQQVVFDLKGDLIEGGILTVEAYTEDFDLVFADFTVE